MSGRPPVRVHIEVLSLPRVTRSRGAAVGDALQAELARALQATPLQQQLRERAALAPVTPSLDGGRLTLTPGERPQKLGQRIAGQVLRGLSGDLPGRRRP